MNSLRGHVATEGSSLGKRDLSLVTSTSIGQLTAPCGAHRALLESRQLCDPHDLDIDVTFGPASSLTTVVEQVIS